MGDSAHMQASPARGINLHCLFSMISYTYLGQCRQVQTFRLYLLKPLPGDRFD